MAICIILTAEKGQFSYLIPSNALFRFASILLQYYPLSNCFLIKLFQFNERNRGPIRNNIDAYNKRTRAAALRRKHL